MKYLIVILTMLIYGGCNSSESVNVNPTNVESTQIIVIRFSASAIGTVDTIGFITPIPLNTLRFNKSDSTGIDSIIFSSSIRTSNKSAKCFLEIYNYTDSTVVPGSLIQSNDTTFALTSSHNLLNNFPNKEIRLVLKIRTNQQNVLVEALSSKLTIYK